MFLFRSPTFLNREIAMCTQNLVQKRGVSNNGSTRTRNKWFNKETSFICSFVHFFYLAWIYVTSAENGPDFLGPSPAQHVFFGFCPARSFWIFFVRPGPARPDIFSFFFWNFFNTKLIKIINASEASEKILMFVLIFNTKTKYMTSRIDRKRIKQWYYYLIPTLEPVSILKPENFQKLKPGPARPGPWKPGPTLSTVYYTC